MQNSSRFRVALVGAGLISPFHAAAIRKVSDAELVGVVDADLVRARHLAERFGQMRTASRLDEFAKDELNVVHIATPPSTHFDLTCQALELGCDVFVEKPLATSVEQCEQIRKLADTVGKKVCVNHSNLRDPFIAQALDMIRAGRIGNVLSVSYLRSSNYPPYSGGPLPPHYRDGGFPFRDIGVHALYLIREFLGDISDVHAVFEHRGDDHNLFFDEWTGTVVCKNGVGQFQLSWNVRPMQNILIVQGSRGVLRCDPYSMYVTSKRTTRLPNFVERVANSVKEGLQIGVQVPWNLARVAGGKLQRYHGVQATVAEFYKSLRTESQVPTTVDDAIPIVHWTEKIASAADAEKKSRVARYSTREPADVLVTGAGGFIGRHLVRELLESTDRVRVLVRREPPQEWIQNPRVDVVIGDLGNPDIVDEAVRGVKAVYHLGAAMSGSTHDFQRGTEVGTRNVVESILRHNSPRLIYVSSLSVLHASLARKNDVITEDWPLEPHPEQRGNYTLFKLRAEQIVTGAVKNRGLEAIIIRPGQVFGPGSDVLTPAVARRAGNKLVVLGNGSVPLPLVYVSDVVDALISAGRSGPFDGTVLHIVDNSTTLDQNGLLKFLGGANSKLGKVVHVPRLVVNGAAVAAQLVFGMMRRRAPLNLYRVRSALSHLEFDCSRAARVLDWRPAVGIEAGLSGRVKPMTRSGCNSQELQAMECNS